MFVRKLQEVNRFRFILRPVRSCLVSSKTSTNSDLFGIQDVTNLDVMGTKERENVNEEEFNKKYSYLNNLNRVDNEETVLNYPHGQIRLDRDNKPKYHGQFDEDNDKMRFDIESLEMLETQVAGETKTTSQEREKENQDQQEQSIEIESTQDLTNRKLKENEITQLLNSISEAKKAQVSEDRSMNRNERQFKRSYTYNENLDKPRRVKIDTSNVDIYDLSSVRAAYSKHKLVHNVNLLYKSLNFQYESQWHKWIERDRQCFDSPLAEFAKQERLIISPILSDKYDSSMASGDLKSSDYKNENDYYKANAKHQNETLEDESNLYSPLKSLNELETELNENFDEDQESSVNESNSQPTLNIEPIFKEQKSTDESKEHITALDYVRKIKNNEIRIENLKLQKLITKRSNDAKKQMDALTLNRKKLEFDSKGFLNYSGQVFSLYNLKNIDRALYLESETFLNNFGFVALNKPYGLVCLGDNEIPRSEVSDRKLKPVKLVSFLDDYAYLIAQQDKRDRKENTFEDLKNPKLYPIFKLDRNCSGVYILAKNKETAVKLHELFEKKQVDLFYDAITKNIPHIDRATIDIPIEQDKKDLKYRRMMLRPELPEQYQALMKPSRFADKAITNYRILKSFESAAHVEINPKTNIRDQIRVHLGFGLRTPILGDHLYDCTQKVDYQKLPLQMLKNLKIRSVKTFQLPLHLHCKMIILNQFGHNQRDLFLKADLPAHFRDNLKALKLD